MSIISQSYCFYHNTETMNIFVLKKVIKLSLDVISIIDDFLGGFAFYKLKYNDVPPNELQKKLMLLLHKNMKDYPQRISNCMLMILMKLSGNTHSITNNRLQHFSSITINTLPISDTLFDICKWIALVEFINKVHKYNYELYCSILSSYLSYVTHTKIYTLYK